MQLSLADLPEFPPRHRIVPRHQARLHNGEQVDRLLRVVGGACPSGARKAVIHVYWWGGPPDYGLSGSRRLAAVDKCRPGLR